MIIVQKSRCSTDAGYMEAVNILCILIRSINHFNLCAWQYNRNCLCLIWCILRGVRGTAVRPNMRIYEADSKPAGLSRCHIFQSLSYQTSEYQFVYVVMSAVHASIALPRLHFTPLKAMNEGRSEMRDSQILYTGLPETGASRFCWIFRAHISMNIWFASLVSFKSLNFFMLFERSSVSNNLLYSVCALQSSCSLWNVIS